LDFSEFEVLTFDCYGTLIDWESGILSAVKPVLNDFDITVSDDEILELYAEFESSSEEGNFIKYREILKEVAHKFADRYRFNLPMAKEYFLAESMKHWIPFPDTVKSLKLLKGKYKLGILSNVDNDLFAYSSQFLDMDFDFLFTAEEIRSYKPSIQNFEFVVNNIGLPKDKILHVAQSLYHDVVPAKSLGISTVWVNRRHDSHAAGATPKASAIPDIEVPDLESLVKLIGI